MVVVLYTLDQKLLTFRAWDTLSCLVHALSWRLWVLMGDLMLLMSSPLLWVVIFSYILYRRFFVLYFWHLTMNVIDRFFFLVIYLGVLNASWIWMSWCLNENCSPQACVFGTLGPQLVPRGNLWTSYRVQPSWRSYVTGGRLWEFIAWRTSVSSLCFLHVDGHVIPQFPALAVCHHAFQVTMIFPFGTISQNKWSSLSCLWLWCFLAAIKHN